MATVIAQFDGQNFVPEQPVDVPVGTKVTITLPVASPPAIPLPPRQPTAEEKANWEEFLRELNATEPYFPTVEEALRYSRKYP